MNNLSEETALQGVWFSTTDLKLAVSLHVAGFPFPAGGECTRIVKDGRESFTWHFLDANPDGGRLVDFVQAWEKQAPAELSNPDPMIRFFVAREAMFARTHIISESHKTPAASLASRGDRRLLTTPRLGREDRERLRQLAS